jgi:hypothetical protein
MRTQRERETQGASARNNKKGGVTQGPGAAPALSA